MVITALRTAIIYIVLIIALRVTGKRQLGELQPIELVVTLLISDLAAVPMQESGISLLNGLVPIAVLVSLELILSAWMMKSNGLSRLISGNPIVIIHEGVVQQPALRKLRLTVEDLTESLRQQGFFALQEIQYAIAETNGKISAFPFPKNQPAVKGDLQGTVTESGAAVPLVNDGKLVEWGMSFCDISEKEVHAVLKQKKCTLSDTLLLTADKNGHYFLIVKEKKQ